MRFTARRNWRTGYTAEAIPIAVQGAATDAGIEATSASKVVPSVGSMLTDGMLAVGVDVEDSAISIGEQKIYCEKSINYDKVKERENCR